MTRTTHMYRVTFAEGTFYDQESSLDFESYIDFLDKQKWMIPDNDKSVCFNMKTIVKVGKRW